MVGVAALTAWRRAPEVPGILTLTLAATSASAALSLFVVFGLGIYPIVGRAVVPIAGMMIGNSIGSIVVASRRILAQLTELARKLGDFFSGLFGVAHWGSRVHSRGRMSWK